MVNAIPFLNILVLGLNIQKVEITKNNRDNPKNIFRKYKGELVLALCNLVILSRKNGNSFVVKSATPMALL